MLECQLALSLNGFKLCKSVSSSDVDQILDFLGTEKANFQGNSRNWKGIGGNAGSSLCLGVDVDPATMHTPSQNRLICDESQGRANHEVQTVN